MADELVVMMAQGHLDAVRAIVRSGGYRKVVDILEGADTRNRTTSLALDWLGDEECNVLFHEAVRPLVSERIPTECFEALGEYAAVDVAIPSADTIIQVDEDNSHPRHPTPCFAAPGTNPSGVPGIDHQEGVRARPGRRRLRGDRRLERRAEVPPDVPIYVVHGEERNMKVTEPIDVYLADKLFQLTSSGVPSQRTEDDYRDGLQGRTMVVFGGSYGTGSDFAQLAERYGARVLTFSRSSNNTHIERRADIASAARSAGDDVRSVDFVVVTAGVLP